MAKTPSGRCAHSGRPITDLLGPIPYLNLQQLFDPAWEAAAGNYNGSAFLDGLPDQAIETLGEYHHGAASLPVQAELHIHHLSGAVARVPPGSTAFSDRSCQFLFSSVARTPNPADLQRHIPWAHGARNALKTYGKGGVYVNFPGRAGEDSARATYPDEIYDRLQAVKNQYDPLNVFRFNINITPIT